jgi:hypothetical protein
VFVRNGLRDDQGVRMHKVLLEREGKKEGKNDKKKKK